MAAQTLKRLATEARERAIESGDTAAALEAQTAELKSERHVLRSLSLRQKSLNKNVSQVSMDAAQRFDGRRPRVYFRFERD